MKIAILVSDHIQTMLIADSLAGESHECHTFTTSDEFVKKFRSDPLDILVLSLDIGEEKVNAVQEIRRQLPSVIPILCIAGSLDEDKIVASLDAGADDYLIRPIRRRALATRVAVLLGRAYPSQSVGEEIRFDQFLFKTRSGRLTRADNPVEVTKKEFDLALLLFRNLGNPISRATIAEAVWAGETIDLSRTIDTHISRVRHKLDLIAERGYRLSTVYGYGYRLDEVKA